jgi:PilZ domain
LRLDFWQTWRMPKPMAFAVRFVAEGQTVQTTSRDLDEAGLFVRCVEPPGIGERVVLRLYLPGIAAGDSIDAIVTESWDEGFRATFTDLSETARGHIHSALTATGEVEPVHLEPLEHENRRYLPRYLDRLHVVMGDHGEHETLNVSGSGMFVRTEEPPEIDQIVQLVLAFPDGAPPAQAQAIVLRQVQPGAGQTAGVGVQFIAADDDFRERLDQYLESLQKR